MNYKRISIALILCVTGLLFALEPCYAQDTRTEKAEQINQFMASKISGDVPGISVLVVHGDRIIFNNAYGFACTTTNSQFAPNDFSPGFGYQTVYGHGYYAFVRKGIATI